MDPGRAPTCLASGGLPVSSGLRFLRLFVVPGYGCQEAPRAGARF